MSLFVHKRDCGTYGLSGETARRWKDKTGFRKDSARNIGNNSASFECSMKRHSACPKKYRATCQCPCHQEAA